MKNVLLSGLIFFLLLETKSAHSQNLTLWDGETPDINGCQFSNGNANNAEPHAGSWAFEAKVDKYNTAGINLKCQNTWRSDISSYTNITFFAKTNTPGTTIGLNLYGWPNTSPTIDLSPYLAGGSLTDSYQLVSIPLSLFKTDSYGLYSVEMIQFKGINIPAGSTVSVFIDDIQVVDEQANQVNSFQLLSDKTVRLDISDRYHLTDVLQTSNYSITSPNDIDYAQATPPNNVGKHYFVTKFEPNTVSPRVKNELFLSFVKPLKNGKRTS